jgi:hypothetical protein
MLLVAGLNGRVNWHDVFYIFFAVVEIAFGFLGV